MNELNSKMVKVGASLGKIYLFVKYFLPFVGNILKNPILGQLRRRSK
jgi:hypothetical protein